jgi:hypothetical protein
VSVPLVGQVREWLKTVPPYVAPRVPEEFTLQNGLTPTDRLILILYADYQQQHTSNPSKTTLAQITGVDRRHVIRVAWYLERLGLLTKVGRGKEGQNTYAVTLPVVTPTPLGASDTDVTSSVQVVTSAPAGSDMNGPNGDTHVTQTYVTTETKGERDARARVQCGNPAHAVCGERLCLPTFKLEQYAASLPAQFDRAAARAAILKWVAGIIHRVDAGSWRNMALELPLEMWDGLWRAQGQADVFETLQYQQQALRRSTAETRNAETDAA